MKRYNLSWNSFLSFSDAKICRISSQNKKLGIFFMKLLRQKPEFVTKQG